MNAWSNSIELIINRKKSRSNAAIDLLSKLHIVSFDNSFALFGNSEPFTYQFLIASIQCKELIIQLRYESQSWISCAYDSAYNMLEWGWAVNISSWFTSHCIEVDEGNQEISLPSLWGYTYYSPSHHHLWYFSVLCFSSCNNQLLCQSWICLLEHKWNNSVITHFRRYFLLQLRKSQKDFPNIFRGIIFLSYERMHDVVRVHCW